MGIKFKSVAAASIFAVGSALLTAVSPVQAKEMRIVIGQASTSELTNGMDTFGKNVAKRTNGRYTYKLYKASLLSYAETSAGIRDGIADIGYMVPAYHRGEFPQTNLLVDMATVSVDPVVTAGAANEYFFSCKECIAETLKQNQVFLGLSVIGPYYMMSKDKIVDKADFKGKKIRGFGPFGRWVEMMGGTAVSMSANDIYESMSQGQLDGNTHILDVLKSLSIGEVSDYVLDAPIGVYIGNSMFNTNRDFWNELSAEDKKSFILSAGLAVGSTTVRFLAANMNYYDNPKSVGVEIVQPSDAVRKANEEFHKVDQDVMVDISINKYKLLDAREKLNKFIGLVKKWEGLVATIDKSDADAVGDLYNREIFDKLDPATFN